ncbi:hypothetical protein ACLKA6_016221 [Drosophila palustris]
MFPLTELHEGTKLSGWSVIGFSREQQSFHLGTLFPGLVCSRPYKRGRILATCGALVASRSISAALALVDGPAILLLVATVVCSPGAEHGAELLEQLGNS